MNRILPLLPAVISLVWFTPTSAHCQSVPSESAGEPSKTPPTHSTGVGWAITADVSDMDLEAEVRIKRSLGQLLDMPLQQTTLAELADFLVSRGVPARIDKRALEDAGIGTDTRCSFGPAGIPLAAALRLTLHDEDLTWMINHEILTITTHDEAESKLKTRLYNVSHLVPSIKRRPRVKATWGEADSSPLERVLRCTVAPESWDEVGGPGSLSGLVINGQTLLVISQTDDVHDQLERVLRNLHRITGTALPDVTRLPASATKPSTIPTTRIRCGTGSQSVIAR